VALALANTGLLRILRGSMRHVQTIAAVFVIISGLYLVYYFWVVDINASSDPITLAVERFQASILAWLNDNWQIAAVVLAAVVATGVLMLASGRRGRGAVPADTAGAGVIDATDATLTDTPSVERSH
jgi:hypothetical protein